MARLLGEDALPEQVNSARRTVRRRASSLREPIRSTREDLVPGPDVIGSLESRAMGLRSKLTSAGNMQSVLSEREGLANRLMNLRGSDSANGETPGNDTSEDGSRGSKAKTEVNT